MFRIKFPAKNSLNAYLYLPRKWTHGAPNIATFEAESRITLELNAAKKYGLYQKMCKKIVQNFLQKTQWVHISILPRSAARDDPFFNLWDG